MTGSRDLNQRRNINRVSARRKGRSLNKRKSRVNATTESRVVPPVMVRSSSVGVALPGIKRKKTKATRRRYDVALNVPGAEMRLPAVPHISFGARWVSGLLILVLAVLIYQLWNAPMYRVNEPVIDGLVRVSARDVNAVINAAEKPVFAIDEQRVETRLQKAFPEFSSVQVDVNLPNEVTVIVEERQPILVWRQGGVTKLVDAQGNAFSPRSSDDAQGMMAVNAQSPPPVAKEELAQSDELSFLPIEMVSAVLSVSAVAPDNTSLIYDQRHGLGWRDDRGWDVYFGTAREIDLKLKIYQALVSKFKKEEIQPTLISVEYPRAPYYRLAR